jgi:hypothetical protein
MGTFLPSYEGFFSGNICYKHCKFNLIFSDLVWLLKNPAKQGDSTNRKKDITILLPLSFICADCKYGDMANSKIF